jgi:thymidylate synthase (FAD)
MIENQNIPQQNTLPKQKVIELDPLGDGISALQLIRISGSDVDVVNGARVSYGKYTDTLSERDEKLINFLMEHDHTSPFEHNQFSFRVKCPIYVARQWMRHRMSSYNEISYRYVQSSLEFYIPHKWRAQDTHNKQSSTAPFENEALLEKYKETLRICGENYEHLIAQGVCREQARGLLPTCTYTEFIYTVNLHSLMNFLRLRLHPGAQWEIRVYAEGMLKLALPHFPISLKAWKKKHAPDLEF